MEGNYIGTNASGTGRLINAGDGVEISFSTQNTIGGTTPGARNLISGNYGDGVGITDFSTDNLVEGNYIGTDYLGTEALGNIQGGISIGDAATNNTVGGITPGARNLISGNYGDGVSIIGTAVGPNTTDNLVLGNYIGTDNNGTEALGNNGNGVSITAAPGNSKGLSTPVAFNLISGNGQNGIAISNVQRPSNGGPFGSLVVGNFIGTDVFGSLPLGNGGDGILLDTAASNTIGGTTPAFRNILSGNSAAGIEIRGGDSISNLVEGNYIGTDKNGKAALANLVGVFINGAPGNTIGGTNASARNLISGNSRPDGSGVGVEIAGPGNLIEGNFIGTDQSGGFPLGNDTGVFINGAAFNTIGGTVQGAGNVIAGYTTSAALLSIQGGVGVDIANAGASDNLVEGNLIGTDATGERALVPSQQPASGVGVLINSTTGSNTIGGVTAAARNVISGFVIAIEIYAAQSSFNLVPGTTVEGDYIGTNALGVVVAGLGNTTGIFVNGVPFNTIGGTARGDGNVISGNTTGIYLLGPTTSGNLVQGNYIGLDPTGTSAEPNLTGIFVNDAMNNTIGGTAPGAGNVIAGNLLVGQVGSTGIYFYSGAAGNLVQSNLIGTNASGKTGKRLGLGDYGILLYNAPQNTYPTRGKGANTIRGSGIAATREYSSGDPLATTSGTTSKGRAKSVPSGPRRHVRRPGSRK